ncbi:MAG: LptA/OstA family protein [Pseudomonadota bacterium]
MTSSVWLSAIKSAFAWIATTLLLTASAHPQDGTGFSLSGDQPVQIDGDRLEVLEDQGRAVFDGNVKIVQGETIVRAGKLVIHYVSAGASASAVPGASAIDRLVASGGVNIQRGDQIATGDTGTFDMASEVFTLTGDRVTLSDNGNLATGCRLVVTMKDSRSRLEGCGNQGTRPTVLIQPRQGTE